MISCCIEAFVMNAHNVRLILNAPNKELTCQYKQQRTTNRIWQLQNTSFCPALGLVCSKTLASDKTRMGPTPDEAKEEECNVADSNRLLLGRLSRIRNKCRGKAGAASHAH